MIEEKVGNPTSSIDAPKVSGDVSCTEPPVIDFAYLENLLPQLILLPRQERGMSKRMREEIGECLRLVEEILALKKSFQLLLAKSAEEQDLAKTSARELDHNGLESLLLDEFSSEIGSIEASQYLRTLRAKMVRRRTASTSSHLTQLISSWDQQLDEAVGRQYLVWLRQASEFLHDRMRHHVAELGRVSGGTLGIFEKFRIWRLSRKVERSANEIYETKKQCEQLRQNLRQHLARLQKLVALGAVLFKVPNPRAGEDARVAKRMILLSFEHDVGEELQRRIVNGKRQIRELSQEIDKIHALISQQNLLARGRESELNQELLRFYSTTNRDVKQTLGVATSSYMQDAWIDVQGKIAEEVDNIFAEEKQLAHSRQEFVRLARILEEYQNEVKRRQAPPVEQASTAVNRSEGRTSQDSFLHQTVD